MLSLKIQHKLMHDEGRSALFTNITDLDQLSQGIGGGERGGERRGTKGHHQCQARERRGFC